MHQARVTRWRPRTGSLDGGCIPRSGLGLTATTGLLVRLNLGIHCLLRWPAEILAAARRHFQTLPAFEEHSSSEPNGEQASSDPSRSSTPDPAHLDRSVLPEADASQGSRAAQGSVATAGIDAAAVQRSQPAQAGPTGPAASDSQHRQRADAGHQPLPAASSQQAMANEALPGRQSAAPLTIRTGTTKNSRAETASAPPIQPGVKTAPFGQSPTPEVLLHRRAARLAPLHHLPAQHEEDDQGGSAPAAEDHTSQAPVAASSPQVTPEARAGPRGLAPIATTAHNRSEASPADSPAASAATLGSTPGRSRQQSPGVGLAMLLGNNGSPFEGGPASSVHGPPSRSGTVTPGTPLTPGHRIVTAATHADHARTSRSGLVGLLQDAQGPAPGRPASMAAVARRLRDSAAHQANDTSPGQ